MTHPRLAREVSKILSANDLGLTGGHQAGILVPKQPEILRFFPSLDDTHLNPRCDVSVFCSETSQYWVFHFIYYNNKVVGSGTRNEYRLTHMTGYLRVLGADVGDTLSFIRSAVGDVEIRLDRQKLSLHAAGKPAELSTPGWKFKIMEGRGR